MHDSCQLVVSIWQPSEHIECQVNLCICPDKAYIAGDSCLLCVTHACILHRNSRVVKLNNPFGYTRDRGLEFSGRIAKMTLLTISFLCLWYTTCIHMNVSLHFHVFHFIPIFGRCYGYYDCLFSPPSPCRSCKTVL